MKTDWEISGADRQTIFGTTYFPDADPAGCVVVAHGFKGYKDFRMIPAFASGLSQSGLVAHAFNFSHSGMTTAVETFERPDLFELDTWNKQVADLRCVVRAVQQGELQGRGLPYLLLGHSRGGVSVILYAGRQSTRPDDLPRPVGVITAAAPDSACSMTDIEKAALREDGYLESPSARTGQMLRVGRGWLIEQEADPEGHDVLANVGRLACPILVLHGDLDETVDVGCATSIASAATNATLVTIEHCDHVFNTPNPPPANFLGIPELAQAIDAMAQFSRQCCGAA